MENLRCIFKINFLKFSYNHLVCGRMQIPFFRVAGLSLLSLLFALHGALAQDALSVDVKKPEKFENKKVGYEKTGEKKFTAPRRFVQNTTTHYNYYFNANNKLNEAISRVKAAHKDDYSQLLPFYNFTLEQTAGEKQELDSVIYKSTIAILIHDLRSNWVDNMYMLMGKAYFYRNQLDSAYLTFQYINYAFSPKEKDGYDKVIGSNSNEGGNAFSIATKEDRGIVKKAFSRPPSRNESFLWQVRTYLAKNELPEAAGLIETLKNDPNFPARLRAELAEVQANWFYKQNAFDSAAFYLEKALPVAADNRELARWEYLIAQLYERTAQPAQAEKFYARAIKHTFDPVMEVFARLNSIRQQQAGGGDGAIQQNINELLKMARKDKYLGYRDIIYYTAAQMELERKNVPGARALLLKSTQFSMENPQQRDKSFLQLADLSFQEKDYAAAKNYYDSVTSVQEDPAFGKRKELLAMLAGPTGIIYRQDSLQRIAALPETEREAFIRKLVKQVRKAQGLREEEPTGGAPNNPLVNNQTQASDLFTNAPKGEWYFNNQSLKAKGFTEFKTKWGNRPNVDNWRRQASINQFAINKQGDNKIGNTPTPQGGNTVTEISYSAFYDNLPLTADKLKLSNDSIENASMELGRAYFEYMEDYPLAIQTFERLLSRFPQTAYKQEALFNLYYAHRKMGDMVKANYYKVQLDQLFPGGKYANALNPDVARKSPDSLLKASATRSYEKIYAAFIEGNFAQAIKDKKAADSLYGERYWTPQLLYIESVYHIQQRNDNEAKKVLSQLIARFADSPLKAKAENLLNVLSRRAEIEAYLTNLQVTRAPDDTASAVTTNQPVVVTKAPPPVVRQDPPVQAAGKPPVEQPKPVEKPKADPPKKDSAQQPATTPVKPAVKTTFTFRAEEPHLVMVVIEKVDAVYVTETRNAFNRFNREKFYNKPIEISNIPLTDDIKLVVMNNFETAAAAIEYVERVRKVAASEIIPWLPATKYAFYIVSPQNLEVLKTTKDINLYKKELSAAYPGKF